MKLQIQMPNKRFAVDLEESICEKHFAGFVCRLLSQEEPARLDSAPLQIEEGTLKEPKEDLQTDANQEEEPLIWENPAFEAPITAPKGFLWLRCPACGKEVGFCARSPHAEVECRSCGAHYGFDQPLKLMYVKCDCRPYTLTYRTNITDSIFDIPCLDCKAPVTVQLHPKKDRYETLQRD